MEGQSDIDANRETWQQSSAVQQLQQGCTRLGLHADVALELVAFLTLKSSFAAETKHKEPQDLSPGTQLDQLWHWMLLNTRVARAVHGLIGCEVDHASTDEEDLTDDIKVVRRLAALNLLAAQGWTPTLAFWEEPGTMLHSLRPTKYGPGEVQLYVHEGASQQLCTLLAHLVDHAWAWVGPKGCNCPGVYFRQAWAPAPLLCNNTAQHPASAAPPVVQISTNRELHNSVGQAAGQAGAAAVFAQPPAAAAAGGVPNAAPRLPSWLTLVFRLLPGQQQALPRLRSSTTVTQRFEADATVDDLYLGAAQYLCPSQEPTQAELEAAAGQLRLVQGITDASTTFTNMGNSLEEAGLDKDRVVQVLQPGQELLPDSFSFTIKTGTGKVLLRLVHKQMNVLDVKQLVTDSEGIPPSWQHLVCIRRRQDANLPPVKLADDMTLAHYGLEDRDEAQLVMQPVG